MVFGGGRKKGSADIRVVTGEKPKTRRVKAEVLWWEKGMQVGARVLGQVRQSAENRRFEGRQQTDVAPFQGATSRPVERTNTAAVRSHWGSRSEVAKGNWNGGGALEFGHQTSHLTLEKEPSEGKKKKLEALMALFSESVTHHTCLPRTSFLVSGHSYHR